MWWPWKQKQKQKQKKKDQQIDGQTFRKTQKSTANADFAKWRQTLPLNFFNFNIRTEIFEE